ncbi:MAG: DUF1194 domain-containing protein [Rhodobiaceae bacterium]|nr:DUF1194 domain-containing protein [Rhodobiaceae bacterium]
MAVSARAQQTPNAGERVDVELVLAADVSLSMDSEERRFQREGYIKALNSPEVLAAIVEGGWGRIALTYVEWAGEDSQTIIVPWTLIDSAATMKGFTDRISDTPSRAYHRTSISAVLEFSAALFDANGFRGMRRVIDVSGDGPNNQGRPVTESRDRIVAQGITINGLPVMIRAPGSGFFDIADLDRYYEHCVIGGPQSFIMPAVGWDGFALAVRRKLLLEIALKPDQPVIMLAQAQTESRPPPDCLVGERIWRDRGWRFDTP